MTSPALADELGQYQHENGQVVPSIRVIPPPIPSDIEFVPESGLAVAIWKTPRRIQSSQGGAGMEDTIWKLFLAQRDLGGSVDKAQTLI